MKVKVELLDLNGDVLAETMVEPDAKDVEVGYLHFDLSAIGKLLSGDTLILYTTEPTE